MNHDFESNGKFFNRDFKDHVAAVTPIGEGLTLINWQKPGTGIYRIVYLLWHSVLFVTGDVGAAVYRWSNRLSIEFLASLNIDYFASKCEASATGRGGKEWFREMAEAAIYSEIQDREPDTFTDEEVKEASLQADSQPEWLLFLDSDLGEKFFGSDAWERGEAGMAPSLEVQYHLAGLKRAWAQIQAEAAKVQA